MTDERFRHAVTAMGLKPFNPLGWYGPTFEGDSHTIVMAAPPMFTPTNEAQRHIERQLNAHTGLRWSIFDADSPDTLEHVECRKVYDWPWPTPKAEL